MISETERKWSVFALVGAGAFMTNLDSSIVNVALPSIMEHFQVPMPLIDWVPMIYLLTVASLLLVGGRVGDIRGRRFGYCFGFGLFTVGSILCGCSPQISSLIISRCLQGIGGALLLANSPALMVDTFPPGERGRALGMVGMLVAAGLIAGPVIGGLILQFFSWPVIFFINVPIGIFFVLLALKVLPKPQSNETKVPMDWAGAVLLICCFSSLVLFISHLHDWGVTSLGGIASLAVFIVSSCLASVVEGCVANPVFSPSLLRVRIFILPVLSAVFMYALVFFVTLLIPFFMVHPLGYSMGLVGTVMMIPFIFLFCIAPISGSLYDKIGSRMLCTAGMLLTGFSFIALSRLTASSNIYDVAWRLAFAGIGMSVFMSPNSTATMTAVPARFRGVASGSVATARTLGMVLGVTFAGMIFNAVFAHLSGGSVFREYSSALEEPFLRAFRFAMYCGFAGALAGAVIAYLRGDDRPGRKAASPT